MKPKSAPLPRRVLFHPLSCAEFGVLREVLGCDSRFRLSHIGPLIASAVTSRQRRPWIERTRAAAAAVPSDWHRTLPPIFILGFWRSGTTLLHELLAADRSFAAPTLIDTLFPADAPFLLKPKHDALGAVARIGFDVADRPPTRMVDLVEVTMRSPQEEEMAMCFLGAPSHFRISFFPRSWQALVEEAMFAAPGSPAAARFRESYDVFLRTLTHKYPGRRLVLKNPANCTRLAMLRELYPDARFVRIDRPRGGVIPSFRKMTDHSFRAFSLQGAPKPIAREEAEAFHARVLARLDEDWLLIEPGRKVSLRYEALTGAPISTVGRVYRELGLIRSAETLRRQRRFWRRRGARWSPKPEAATA